MSFFLHDYFFFFLGCGVNCFRSARTRTRAAGGPARPGLQPVRRGCGTLRGSSANRFDSIRNERWARLSSAACTRPRYSTRHWAARNPAASAGSGGGASFPGAASFFCASLLCAPSFCAPLLCALSCDRKVWSDRCKPICSEVARSSPSRSRESKDRWLATRLASSLARSATAARAIAARLHGAASGERSPDGSSDGSPERSPNPCSDRGPASASLKSCRVINAGQIAPGRIGSGQVGQFQIFFRPNHRAGVPAAVLPSVSSSGSSFFGRARRRVATEAS